MTAQITLVLTESITNALSMFDAFTPFAVTVHNEWTHPPGMASMRVNSSPVGMAWL